MFNQGKRGLMPEEPNRREQILEAAFEEFAANGFKGATIKSIAQAAELQSPALIYHYFSDKETLFKEILESQVLKAPFMQVVSDPAPMMDFPPEEVLKKLGAGLFQFRATQQRTIRLVVGEVFRHQEIAEMWVRIGPGRVLGFLETYLDRQIELSRLRPHDTHSSARVFIGMLMPQVIGQVFFPTLLEDGLTDEEYLETAIQIFLEGLRPEE
jgi:AcrR family transcriptional regulator